jgi:HEAT repeat protein
MPARRIDHEIEQMSSLRDAPELEAVKALRKALKDRVNLIVAKAAKVIAERHLDVLVPDLLVAFDRMFIDPVKTDSQCWGKVAIAKALRDLEYRDSPPFRRGMQHVQMEPVWGKHEDTAQSLRGACLLALVACTDTRKVEVFQALVDALTEPEAVVRIEAVRGLAEMGGDEATLLLRMKARIGDDEPPIIRLVFDGLCRLEGDSVLPFLARFFDSPAQDVRVEAALAIGASRSAAAVRLLTSACDRTRDPGFRDVFFRSLSISRQPEAIEYLKGLLKTGRSGDLTALVAALELHREDPDVQRLLDGLRPAGEPSVD